MNPRSQQALNRLIAAARRAPDERDIAASFGFATRVAARVQAAGRSPFAAFERISLRAMVLAGALAVVAAASSYSTLARLFQEEATPSDDPVAELVDAVS